MQCVTLHPWGRIPFLLIFHPFSIVALTHSIWQRASGLLCLPQGHFKKSWDYAESMRQGHCTPVLETGWPPCKECHCVLCFNAGRPPLSGLFVVNLPLLENHSPYSLYKGCLLAIDKNSSINIHPNFHFTFHIYIIRPTIFLANSSSGNHVGAVEIILRCALGRTDWRQLISRTPTSGDSDRQLHGVLLYRTDTRLCLIWWGLTSSCWLPGSEGDLNYFTSPDLHTFPQALSPRCLKY